MKLSSICSEAWRNILNGSSHCILAILVLTFLTVGSSSFEILTSANILRQASQYKASGGNIMVLSAEGGVDGQACEHLSELNDVQASGAIRESDQLIASALPDTKIPGYTVTAGFTQVLHAREHTESQGVLISDELAKTLGLQAGNELALKDGRHARIRGTYAYPDDGRTPGYSYAILSPTASAGTFDSCWVSVWPQTDSTQSAIWSVLTPSAKSDKNSSITLGQLNSSLGTIFDGQSLYRARTSKMLPAMAACVGFALGYAIIRIRRLGIASALHCGVSKVALLLQICIESLLIILIAAVITISLADMAVIQYIDAIDRQQVLLAALCPSITGCASYFLGTLACTLVIKERHLFIFFKER